MSLFMGVGMEGFIRADTVKIKPNKPWGVWLATIVIIALLIYSLSAVLAPFLVAALLAYLSDPLVEHLCRWKIPRLLGVILVLLLLLALVVLLLFILIPLLEQQIALLIQKVPTLLAWGQSVLTPWLADHLGVQKEIDISQFKFSMANHWQQAGDILGKTIRTVTGSGLALISWLTRLLLIPVVFFYLLRDWPKVLVGLQQLLPRRIEPTVSRLIRECDEVLGAFLRGQLLVMLALGIMYAVGLAIVGLDTALLIGMIGGLVSIVPYLGFIVGITSASIAAYLQFHSLWHVAAVWLVFVIAQSIEASVLTPQLVGDRIGLHPVVVIFAVLAGGQLFGFTGILLALPVAAVLMVFIRYFRGRYLRSIWYH